MEAYIEQKGGMSSEWLCQFECKKIPSSLCFHCFFISQQFEIIDFYYTPIDGHQLMDFKFHRIDYAQLSYEKDTHQNDNSISAWYKGKTVVFVCLYQEFLFENKRPIF